jgi:hypothetical protein
MCEKNGWTKTLRGMTKFGAVAERNKTMSVRDIELFTEITGDRNPLHDDDKRTNLLIVGAGRLDWRWRRTPGILGSST